MSNPTAETTPPKRPRGRPPGTTKIALELRRAGADMHTPIDRITSYLAPTDPPRRGPGRPRGVTKAVMEARRANPAPPKPRKDGRGGARPGAGRPAQGSPLNGPVRFQHGASPRIHAGQTR
jgi:hypothetical protein